MSHKHSVTRLAAARTWLHVSFERKLFVASVFLFIISLIMLCTSVVVSEQRTHIPAAGVAIGKSISSGTATMTVQKVSYQNGTSHFVAPSGFRYLVATVQIHNTSDKSINIAPSMDTYVKTSAGKVFYLTPFELQSPFHSGLILPSESTEGELSYLVPKDTDAKFYIESSWSGGAVPFMVQSTDNHKRDTP